MSLDTLSNPDLLALVCFLRARQDAVRLRLEEATSELARRVAGPGRVVQPDGSELQVTTKAFTWSDTAKANLLDRIIDLPGVVDELMAPVISAAALEQRIQKGRPEVACQWPLVEAAVEEVREEALAEARREGRGLTVSCTVADDTKQRALADLDAEVGEAFGLDEEPAVVDLDGFAPRSLWGR